VEGHGGDGTPAEAEALVEAVHALHGAVGTYGLPFEPVASARDATVGQVRRWTGVYRDAVSRPVPLLDEAEAWLIERAPDGVLAVVHGDAGPRNVLFADDLPGVGAGTARVAALTDFEFCHLGDVAEDWTFCATMRGRHVMDRAGWAAVIARITGWELDDEGWRYWEAFNHLKGAAANLTALKVFRDGTNPAPNMLIVGTTLHQVFLKRVAELVG
jgi:aminoglycoside phosphotransferase (APT) family kinase protein